MTKEEFIQEGYTVIDGNTKTENNKLLDFLKQNYPSVIKDGELKVDELKSLLNIPFDEKMNGYGLNFIGRNVAKAKYTKETDKALKINAKLSKDFDNTENLVLKGDNLDCLKILKSHYTGKIKCIYIDPPYNTDSENFIYPDKFNEEEREVLGLSNMTEEDLERLEFSFKTKKSHNGWLTFMYPRLKLAHDLLSKDGIIFISINDIEQANLKVLSDDIFGEDNFIANLVWANKEGGGKSDSKFFRIKHEYILVYAKNSDSASISGLPVEDIERYSCADEYEESRGKFQTIKLDSGSLGWVKSLDYPIDSNLLREFGMNIEEDITFYAGGSKEKWEQRQKGIHMIKDWGWRWSKEKLRWGIENDFVVIKNGNIYTKQYLNVDKHGNIIPRTIHPLAIIEKYSTTQSNKKMKEMFGTVLFTYSKPVELIKEILKIGADKGSTILDFFAGSGTTGHAVMELNKEDGGNRKFILCQIDEPIDQKKNKGAYDFCINNNFPPVISSITCERLNRAGEKIKKELEGKESPATLYLGYKVFDLVDKPKLLLKDEQMEMFIENDKALSPLDSIYNMIFKVGIDNPLITPAEVLKDCIYLCKTNNEKHYYITNSQQLDSQEGKDLLRKAINDGKVYIDGWTATLNTTLQQYKGKDDKDKIAIIF